MIKKTTCTINTLWKYIFIFQIFISFKASSQQTDYFFNIPEAPAEYSSNNVIARMIDGLGFRYYWATYGLNEADLAYKPSEEARTTLQTLQHIDGLTRVSLNAITGKPTLNENNGQLSFDDLRSKTLKQLEETSVYLRTHSLDPEKQTIRFGSSDSSGYPLWNLINGPLADALWHVGQVVSFRRSSGNPLPKGVNVLEGTKN